MADLSRQILDELLTLADLLTVPTRFHFPSAGTPDLSPAFDAAWQETASAVRRVLQYGPRSGTGTATILVTSTTTNPEKHLAAQFVSGPLRAQTITGNVRGQFRVLESATGFNGTLQIGIRILKPDGTVRGTLLAVGGSTTTTTTPPEFSTTLTNHRLLTSGDAASLPLSSVACQDGDRLVIEIGCSDKSASTIQTALIGFGDSNGTDLPENDTTTTANDPWVEFDSTIQFLTAEDVVKISDGGFVGIQPQGWIKISEELTASIDAGSSVLSRQLDDETLHLSDQLYAQILLIEASVGPEVLHVVDTIFDVAIGLKKQLTDESVHVVDTVFAEVDPLMATPGTEATKVGDQAFAALVLLVNLSESLKVADQGQSQVTLVGVLRISDADLTAILTTGGPFAFVHDEGLSIVDQAIAARGLTATPSESLKISEEINEQIDPLQVAPQEIVKSADVATTAATLQTSITETNLLADGVVSLLDPIETPALETIKISELAIGQIQGTVVDTLRLADLDPVLQLNPIQILIAEVIKISESLTPARTLEVVILVETIKVKDKVNDLSTSIFENLTLGDIGHGQTSLLGVIHMTDGPVFAGMSNLIGTSTPGESVHVVDIVVVVRTPLEAIAIETLLIGTPSGQVELIRDDYFSIGDQIFASISAQTDLNTASEEPIHVVDTVFASRGLDARPTDDTVLIADLITVSRGLTTTLTESSRVADVIAQIQDLFTSLGESARLADTPQTSLTFLQTTAQESVQIGEILARQLFNPSAGLLSTLINQEQLSIVDVLAVSLDLSAAVTDTVHVVDALVAQGQVDLVIDDENFRVKDVVGVGLTPLFVTVSENVRVSDEDEGVHATLALVLVLQPEALKASDADLTLGLDLATDVSGDIFVVAGTISEKLHLTDRLTARLRPITAIHFHREHAKQPVLLDES